MKDQTTVPQNMGSSETTPNVMVERDKKSLLGHGGWQSNYPIRVQGGDKVTFLLGYRGGVTK